MRCFYMAATRDLEQLLQLSSQFFSSLGKITEKLAEAEKKNQEEIAKLPAHVVHDKFSLMAYQGMQLQNKQAVLHFKEMGDSDELRLNVPHFFKLEPYKIHLNAKCKRVIDLGIGSGQAVAPLYNQGFTIIGYEYEVLALSMLKNQYPKVEVRKIDLNSMKTASEVKDVARSETGPKTSTPATVLAYRDQLRDDLRHVSNIVSLNCFQYLKREAATLLLMDLRELAQPGSVLFISNSCFETKNPAFKAEFEKGAGAFEIGFVPSFFKGSSFNIKKIEKIPFSAESIESLETLDVPEDVKMFEEVVIVEKLPSLRS